MLKEPFAKFAMKARHDLFARANIVAAAIVCVGLLAVARAISLQPEGAIQDLSGPIRSAGIFAFLGCAFLVAVRLVAFDRALDRLSKNLDQRVEASDRRVEEAMTSLQTGPGAVDKRR